MFQAASPGSVCAFVLICLAVLGALLLGLRASAKHAGVAVASRVGPALAVLLAWLGLFSGLVASGWIEAQPMPRLLIVFASVNLFSLGVGLSPVGRWLAEGVPLAWLVAFQSFRLPLELVLHDWTSGGTIPGTMTWTGSNWDIVSGLAALLLAPLCGRWRAAAWISNAIGLLLLVNVARVAVLSSPFPFSWGVTPPLLLLLHLPYAWIVPICVGGALCGHAILTRALLQR